MSKQTPSRSRFARLLDDRPQLLEPPAERRALPGRRFQQDLGFQFFAALVDFVQSLGHAGDSLLFAAGGERARMGDQVGDAQEVAADQLVVQGIDRLLPQLARRGWPD